MNNRLIIVSNENQLLTEKIVKIDILGIDLMCRRDLGTGGYMMCLYNENESAFIIQKIHFNDNVFPDCLFDDIEYVTDERNDENDKWYADLVCKYLRTGHKVN